MKEGPRLFLTKHYSLI